MWIKSKYKPLTVLNDDYRFEIPIIYSLQAELNGSLNKEALILFGFQISQKYVTHIVGLGMKLWLLSVYPETTKTEEAEKAEVKEIFLSKGEMQRDSLTTTGDMLAWLMDFQVRREVCLVSSLVSITMFVSVSYMTLLGSLLNPRVMAW